MVYQCHFDCAVDAVCISSRMKSEKRDANAMRNRKAYSN